jgi:hypothetical protein
MAGFEMPLLTISANHNLDQKPICMVLARQHPGETVSSYIMEGFLEFIIGDSIEAQSL